MKRSNRRYKRLGGMSQQLQAEPPQAELIVDMRWDPRGMWRKMPGYELVSAGSGDGALTKEILWLHSFSPTANGSERFILYESVQTDTTKALAYLDLRTGLPVILANNRRRTRLPSHGTTAVEYNGWIYVFDGANPPVRFSPDLLSGATAQRVRPVGFTTPPGAPEVVGSIDVDIVDVAGVLDWTEDPLLLAHGTQRGIGTETANDVWEYGWATVVWNDLGMQSPRSAIVFGVGETNAETVGSSTTEADVYRRGAVVSVPPAFGKVHAVGLLRTRQLSDSRVGTPELHLRAIGYHASGFDFIDIGPDQELGELFDPDAVGAFPLGARMAAIWQQTMFIVARDQNVIHYSHPGFVEQFPPLNTLPVADSDSGPITSIHTTPRGVLIFCERSTFMVKGDAYNGFVVDKLAASKGSESPRGVAYIPGIGHAFLDPNGGPHVVTGTLDDDRQTSVLPLPDAPMDTWQRRVNVSALPQARVVVDPLSREVWWHLPEGGNTRQTLGIVFHYEAGAWSLREGWPVGDFAFDGRFTWIGSNETVSDPGIFAIADGVNTKNGREFEAKYRLAWQVDDQKRQPLQGFRFHVLGKGDDDLEVFLRSDRKLDWLELAETPRKALAPEWQPDLWGTATWSATSLWEDYVPVVVEVHAHNANGFEHQVELRSTDRVFLMGIDAAESSQRSSLNPHTERQR